jgi:hypothetical protein
VVFLLQGEERGIAMVATASVAVRTGVWSRRSVTTSIVVTSIMVIMGVELVVILMIGIVVDIGI